MAYVQNPTRRGSGCGQLRQWMTVDEMPIEEASNDSGTYGLSSFAGHVPDDRHERLWHEPVIDQRKP